MSKTAGKGLSLMIRLFAGALAVLLTSPLMAQTYTQMQWGMNKATTPYQFGANINSVWRNLGTVTASGVWSIPSSSLSFTAPATGAVTNTLATKEWQGVVDLVDFSPYGCDGVHDVSSALSTAIAALNTAFGGGTVRLPAGDCVASSGVVITQNNINIVGAGRGATRWKVGFATGDVFAAGSSVSITRRIGFSGFSVLCTAPHTSGAVIHVDGADQVTIEDVAFGDPTVSNSGCYHGFSVDSWGNHSATKIVNSFAVNGGGSAFLQSAGGNTLSAEVFLDNLTLSTYSNGLTIRQSGGTYMTNVSIFGMTNVGCSLEPPTGKIIFAIRAYDLICDSSTNGNFYIGGAGKVTDVQLVNLRTSTTDGNNVYIDSGPTIDGVEFYGLSSTYADLHGIVVQNSGAINLKFLGGKSCNNSRAASNTYDDFVVATATQKFDIVDMALGPCDELGAGQSRYALSINAGADNFIARDNRLSGGLTANYNGPVASSSRLIDNLSY